MDFPPGLICINFNWNFTISNAYEVRGNRNGLKFTKGYWVDCCFAYH